MNGPEQGKVDGPDTCPTICPRCHTRGTLKFSAHPSINTLRLRADGVFEKEEAMEQKSQYGLTCPKCLRKYRMLVEFIAGEVHALKVSSNPLLSMPDNIKEVEPVEVFYSQAKKWWFSKRGEKIEEIGPGEPPDSSLR